MYIPPVCLFPLLAVLLPAAFYVMKPARIWYSLALAVLVDCVVYWDDFTYYEARPLMLLCTLAQLALMAAIILLLKIAAPGRKK